MFKLWIFSCFVLTGLIRVNSDSCVLEALREAERCGNLWGYETSRGFNFATMIKYCRDSHRADIGQCITDAYADCPEVLPESLTHLFPRQLEMLSLGLAYLCSKVQIIEENQVCLGRNSPAMQQCEMNASRNMFEESGQQRFDTLSWEDQRSLMERMSRSNEACAYDLLKTDCNTEIAKFFGNFIYAISTYIYE